MEIDKFTIFVAMNKRTGIPSTSQKRNSKYHEKFVVNASFEELVKLAVNTPPLKKRKKKDD